MKPQSNETWSSGVIPEIGETAVTGIISQIADLGVVLSHGGTVLGVLANPGFKPKDMLAGFEGVSFVETLTRESVPKFQARLSEFLQHPERSPTVEMNHAAANGFPEFPVRYSFHALARDDAYLLMGRDLRPVAEMQQQLIAAQITLERDYEIRRESDTQYRVLMASIDDATFFLSLPDGTVKDCNPAARALLGKQGADLTGVSIDHLFETKSKGELVERLTLLASESAKPKLTLKARVPGRMVTIKPTIFRSGGDHAMLCRIIVQASDALKSDTLQDNLSGLYEKGPDAIVFLNASGTILSANEAFLNLADVTHGQALKGRGIVDFLGRGGVDLKVMLENAARSGAMRAYATRIKGEFGAERAVEISTTHVQAVGEPIFAMVLRDISRADITRTETQQVGDVDMQSVIELIGNRSLRDIVANTTDVVEKMCIETAVELTSNNRVAAAEMLGLSRQSLYVKLRKYGLLKSGGDDAVE